MRRSFICKSGLSFRKHPRGAAALLMLLIVIVILMMLYFLDIGRIFGPSMTIQSGSGGSSEDRPWLEEERIVDPGVTIPKPKPPKVSIEKTRSIKARVTREGQDRGWLELEFRPSGNVTGSWHCEFSHEKRETTFDATVEGNIDAGKTFEDDQGTDKSLMYFITKGRYMEQVYNRTTTRGGVGGGEVFVTGWIGSDWHGQGKITLTTDRRASVNFDLIF
ncbi:MAG: hypothetical protein JXA82_13365 [Sedimentisphaerales bacterium]|nr:hypothetical protein [Sedimentisphaerales bacterium]